VYSQRIFYILILIMNHTVNSDTLTNFTVRGAGVSFAVAGERMLVMLTPRDNKWISVFRQNTTMLILSFSGEYKARHSLLYPDNEIEDLYVGSYLVTRAGNYRLSISPSSCKFSNTL
jgi:hypothetical protein